ncbi:MAG: hypothetical protein DHS20C19_25230 [Acidimicrobiales bacterium]|nr:MAG: hypothetical protein DHS20C19_25230 [Acidimicrobiales bacterium]
MARVFVSYRRADGRLAVDWLAERLQALDAIDGVESAFHDVALRIGDNFPAALEKEIADCTIVMVVIGPEWAGHRQDGSARIRDEDDWVVREIRAAFEQGKDVLPVVIGGATPPLAADLHPDIAGLSDIHGLPLTSKEDLDAIVDQIAEMFRLEDYEAAKVVGLEDPVVVPDLANRRSLVQLIAAGALVGGLLAAVSAFLGDVDTDTAGSFASTDAYAIYGVLLVLYGAFGGAVIPVGALLSYRIVRQSRVRWRDLALGALIAGAVPALVLTLTSSSHVILGDEATALPYGTWRAAGNVAAIVLTLACWVLPAGSGIYAEPDVQPHEIGRRVAHLAVLRDAERWAILVATGILTIGTTVSISLEAARAQSSTHDLSAVDIIAVPLILSAVIVLLHRWALTAMAETQAAIEREAATIVEPYATNATGRLAAEPLADGGWGFRLVLALPVIAAVVGVMIATGWP